MNGCMDLIHKGWFVCTAVFGATEEPAQRREVVISNGTALPCADDEYLAHVDGLCHTCEDCVSGQMCSRHGASQGCHDCPEGRYDHDFDALTNCVDCPSGLISAPQSTSCVEPDDFWDKVEQQINTIIGIIGAIIGILAALGCSFDRYCKSDTKYAPIDRDATSESTGV